MKKEYDEYVERIGKELKSIYPHLYFKLFMEDWDSVYDGMMISLYITVYETKDIISIENEITTCSAKELCILECCYKTIKRFNKEYEGIIKFSKETIDKYKG